MKKIFFLILALLLIGFGAISQVGISTDSSIPNSSAMLDVQSTTKGILIPRLTMDQRIAIINPANGLMVYQTDDVSGFYYYNSIIWQRIGESGGGGGHYAGELFGGGMVFWVDNTGQHGYIVSLIDLSASSQWSPSTTNTGAESTWNGEGNSSIISGISPAAQLCLNYSNANYGTGVYSDWYLPAIDQLSLIYHTRQILNKNLDGISGTDIMANEDYWSSTENDNYDAWLFYFNYAYCDYSSKFSTSRVRAVRSF